MLVRIILNPSRVGAPSSRYRLPTIIGTSVLPARREGRDHADYNRDSRRGIRAATACRPRGGPAAASVVTLTSPRVRELRRSRSARGTSTRTRGQDGGFGIITNRAGPPIGSARLIQLGGVPADTIINFDAELPSYDLFNVRWGLRGDRWEAALFVYNLTDERAFLSIDRERGRSARVGYLTNPPRTIGVNYRMNF